ncbi:MAG: hypothetical protein JRI72_16155 [Deltaproteobacteria bacterium]|nr:hypothetical protein [Deltaproteobacteria bacterium]
MKVKLLPFISFITFLFFIGGFIPAPHANAQGQARAMKERADTVSKRKNRFVAKVLNQYGINYTIDRYGIVTRINVTGEWRNVTRIDVVPMVRMSSAVDKVIGHEIFIYTDKETVHLLSHLKVR